MKALTTTRRLTAQDVESTLQDDRHLGWGLACANDLPKTTRDRLVRIVAEVANDSGWDYEDLFLFSNSRPARHMTDEFHGPRLNGEAFRHVVRNYVNPNMLAVLRADEAKGY